MHLLVGVELVADPRELGELDITVILGVLVGIGAAIEAVLGLTDPAVGVVFGAEENRVQAELLDVAIRVVVPTGTNGAAEVEVVGDLHGHGRGRKGAE
ncbi:hypothetical protein D3C71_1968590 [compost metagenome]